MNKYKVTLELMVDPLNGDRTIKKVYEVEAENESKAYSNAVEEQGKDEEVMYRSCFNYTVKQVNQ